MAISLDNLIQIITTHVIRELKRQGIEIISHNGKPDSQNAIQGLYTKSEKIDMSKYKSPVLTENHIRRLHELTGEIVIPRCTVITPKASELIKIKNISVVYD